jgi:hypothetical protein
MGSWSKKESRYENYIKEKNYTAITGTQNSVEMVRKLVKTERTTYSKKAETLCKKTLWMKTKSRTSTLKPTDNSQGRQTLYS